MPTLRLVSRRSLTTLLSCALLWFAPEGTLASDLAARPGWIVMPSTKPYSELLPDLRAAIRTYEMGLVSEAGPTEVAAKRGVTIPGNRVVGVFRNDYAVKVLALSTAAMIEAPIRFYVTEHPDGTGATLSYKTPSFVFAPYTTGSTPELIEIGKELDQIFSDIAKTALN